MPSGFVLALDQGTTGSTALVVDPEGAVRARGYAELPQHYPRPGWVEHDPEQIWATVERAATQALAAAGIGGHDLAAVGITNQRETTIVWDRTTGAPIHHAVVWQCRRTAPTCDRLRAAGHEPMVRERTGLVLDAYFSGTKVAWILDHVPDGRRRAARGQLAFGTVDTWLLWKLTRGRVHATDVSNASRTLCLNLATLDWDDRMCGLLGVPREVLPTVVDSSGTCAETEALGWLPAGIPIAGIAGDQQAALFGQACFRPGDAKNTYGTGCFALTNTGERPVTSSHGLLTTVAWRIGGRTTYALEGAVFIAGAAVQWLRDGLGIIAAAADTDAMARSVPDTGGVYFVPAFVGLGAPYWDQHARGTVVGLTRGTTRAHLARAALEAIAFQSRDVLEAMAADAKSTVTRVRVDGGAVANDFLCQFQADILGASVDRPAVIETTGLGAAYLAGLGAGVWRSLDAVAERHTIERTFRSAMKPSERNERYETWKRAVERSRDWAPHPSATKPTTRSNQ
jgi:glycerol kinase